MLGALTIGFEDWLVLFKHRWYDSVCVLWIGSIMHNFSILSNMVAKFQDALLETSSCSSVEHKVSI